MGMTVGRTLHWAECWSDPVRQSLQCTCFFLISRPHLAKYDQWLLFYFFKVQKGSQAERVTWHQLKERCLIVEYLQNLLFHLFFPFFFSQGRALLWLHIQTSDLKIAKFHLDCGGVKDRRQMHWLPASLDIHFFFPHPGSQQLHTRTQVRSLGARHVASVSLFITNSLTRFGIPTLR